MSAALIALIDAHVAANWSHTPIIAPNGDSTMPVDNSAYMDVQYPFGRERMLTTGDPGNNFFRREGGFRIILMVPLGRPLNDAGAPWLDRLDALQAAMRGKNIGGVILWEPSPYAIASDNEVGGYYEISFAVEYQYEIIA